MSCHGCGTRFGLFTKENGCPVCGFAYCSSCLKFKCEVPTLGKGQHKVCKMCYTGITSGNENKNEPIAPPDSFLKKLESMANPTRPPITVYKTNKRTANLRRGLSDKDLEIFDRLEKLRADRRPDPAVEAVSVEEIERRLALLRGQNPDIMAKKPCYTAPDVRSQQEKSDVLLDQATEELKLESQVPSAEHEIEERLRRLRSNDDDIPDGAKQPVDENTNPVPSQLSLDEIAERLIKSGSHNFKDEGASVDGGSSSSKQVASMPRNAEGDHQMDSSDDENEIKKIIAKANDLARIEREKEEMELDDPASDQEELPWCCICNEDASRRCVDCDNELYCDYCFKEGHQDKDMKTHKSVPYRHQQK